MVSRMLATTTLTIFMTAFRAFGQDGEGFIEVRREGDITLHERWIPLHTNPDTKVREIKAEFYYRNSLEAGLNLLRNEKKAAAWKSHLEEFKIYPKDSAQWFEYTYHDVPWPVSDQDHFLHYEIKRLTPHYAHISFRSIDGDKRAPLKEGVTRIFLRGSWSFEQVDRSRVRVIYRATSIPIGLPRVFTDPIIRNSLMTTVSNFVKLLEHP